MADVDRQYNQQWNDSLYKVMFCQDLSVLLKNKVSVFSGQIFVQRQSHFYTEQLELCSWLDLQNLNPTT